MNNNNTQIISEKMKKKKRPLIVLISGARGVGKTTIAHQLACILDIRQRIGLGAIVKTLRFIFKDEIIYSSIDNEIQGGNIKAKLLKQGEIIGSILSYIIKRYDNEKVHCIIDGIQLIPRYLPLDSNIFLFHLSVTDSEYYYNNLANSCTRTPRKPDKEQFNTMLQVDSLLLSECVSSKAFVIAASRSVDLIISDILNIIHSNYK